MALENFYNTFSEYPTAICHGGCRGADMQVSAVWKERLGNLRVVMFEAEWRKYGRPAGPIRNRDMVVKFKPHVVVAFHDNLERSLGTINLIDQAMKLSKSWIYQVKSDGKLSPIRERPMLNARWQDIVDDDPDMEFSIINT